MLKFTLSFGILLTCIAGAPEVFAHKGDGGCGASLPCRRSEPQEEKAPSEVEALEPEEVAQRLSSVQKELFTLEARVRDESSQVRALIQRERELDWDSPERDELIQKRSELEPRRERAESALKGLKDESKELEGRLDAMETSERYRFLVVILERKAESDDATRRHIQFLEEAERRVKLSHSVGEEKHFRQRIRDLQGELAVERRFQEKLQSYVESSFSTFGLVGREIALQNEDSRGLLSRLAVQEEPKYRELHDRLNEEGPLSQRSIEEELDWLGERAVILVRELETNGDATRDLIKESDTSEEKEILLERFNPEWMRPLSEVQEELELVYATATALAEMGADQKRKSTAKYWAAATGLDVAFTYFFPEYFAFSSLYRIVGVTFLTSYLARKDYLFSGRDWKSVPASFVKSYFLPVAMIARMLISSAPADRLKNRFFAPLSEAGLLESSSYHGDSAREFKELVTARLDWALEKNLDELKAMVPKKHHAALEESARNARCNRELEGRKLGQPTQKALPAKSREWTGGSGIPTA